MISGLQKKLLDCRSPQDMIFEEAKGKYAYYYLFSLDWGTVISLNFENSKRLFLGRCERNKAEKFRKELQEYAKVVRDENL